jgi:hypothetical protein
MIQLLFLTPKTLTRRDGLNHVGTFVPILSPSHLVLAGGQLSDLISIIELTDKLASVQDSI